MTPQFKCWQQVLFEMSRAVLGFILHQNTRDYDFKQLKDNLKTWVGVQNSCKIVWRNLLSENCLGKERGKNNSFNLKPFEET